MKKVKLISLGLMLTMLGTGCNLNMDIPQEGQQSEESDSEKDADSIADDEDTADNEDDNKDAASDSSAEDDDDSADDNSANDDSSEELSSAELSELQDLFNSATYNHFFDTAFESPEQIDWTDVLIMGGGISEVCDYRTEEWEKVNEAYGGFPDCGDTIKISSDDVTTYVKDHSGLDFNDSMISKYWFYSEEYDAYYYQRGDYGIDELICVSGSRIDDEYTVRLERQNPYRAMPAREIVFTKDGDNLVFKSNTFLWEEIVDSKTYELTTSQWGDVIVYTVTTTDYCSLVVTKDGGDVFTWEPFFDNAVDKRRYFTEITDIAFVDVSADGFTDMLVIGETSQGPAVYFGIGLEHSIYISYSGSTVTSALDGNINMDSVIEYMIKYSDDGEYADFNHAYAQNAFIESLNLSARFYGLQDINDDNVPELIIASSSELTIYTFEDGVATLLVHTYCGTNTTGPIYGLKEVNYEDLNASYDFDQLIDELDV